MEELDAKDDVLTPRERSFSVTGRNTSLKLGASYEDHRNVASVKLDQVSSWARLARPVGQIVPSDWDWSRGGRLFNVNDLLATVCRTARHAGKARRSASGVIIADWKLIPIYRTNKCVSFQYR